MKSLARTRALGGSVIVTIPKEIAREEGIRPGDLIEFEVGKVKRSYFGVAKGIGSFKKEDKLDTHD